MSSYKLLKTIGVVAKPIEHLTHKQRVVRAYRGLLKNSLNWTITRDKWYPIASEIKSEFKSNMFETNPATVTALLAKAEDRLQETQHPDPYISMLLGLLFQLILIIYITVPYAPGGSKWQRNTPVPYDVRIIIIMIYYFLI